jgi:hypothetical protein
MHNEQPSMQTHVWAEVEDDSYAYVPSGVMDKKYTRRDNEMILMLDEE